MAVDAGDLTALQLTLAGVLSRLRALNVIGLENVVTCAEITALRASAPARSAAAGSPGVFEPSTSSPPNLAALTGVTAVPDTAWTEGQHVVLRDESKAYWDSNSWEAGEAPAP